MAALAFELVSPERRLASAEAEMVVAPGMEGDFGALPGHAPFLTTLRPGVVAVTAGGKTEEYFVTGGFAEINETEASVLAEEAMPKADVTSDFLDAKLAEAEKAHAEAAEDGKMAAAQRVLDFKTAKAQMGL